jgi:hypothetical protein
VQAARQFVEILRRNGLAVWFDKDSLQPGCPWMATLEAAISNASAMIVYIGSLGHPGLGRSRGPARAGAQHA